MGFTQDQKIRFIGTVMKTLIAAGCITLIGVLVYNIAIAESRGRERALLYEK